MDRSATRDLSEPARAVLSFSSSWRFSQCIYSNTSVFIFWPLILPQARVCSYLHQTDHHGYKLCASHCLGTCGGWCNAEVWIESFPWAQLHFLKKKFFTTWNCKSPRNFLLTWSCKRPPQHILDWVLPESQLTGSLELACLPHILHHTLWTEMCYENNSQQAGFSRSHKLFICHTFKMLNVKNVPKFWIKITSI